MNARLTRAIRHMPKTYSMPYAHIFHVYSLVSIGTLARMLKSFVTYCFECQAICDTIVKTSENPLMGKYSLVLCSKLLLYGIIDGRYIAEGTSIQEDQEEI